VWMCASLYVYVSVCVSLYVCVCLSVFVSLSQCVSLSMSPLKTVPGTKKVGDGCPNVSVALKQIHRLHNRTACERKLTQRPPFFWVPLSLPYHPGDDNNSDSRLVLSTASVCAGVRDRGLMHMITSCIYHKPASQVLLHLAPQMSKQTQRD